MTANRFGNLLKKARKRNKLTQEELADQVGFDNSYISRIERGENDPPMRDKVIALADALHITTKSERIRFLLASVDDADWLNEKDQAEEPRDVLPFGVGAFGFPESDETEEEDLIEEIRGLLESPNLTQEERTKYIALIRSFVGWLEFEMGGKK